MAKIAKTGILLMGLVLGLFYIAPLVMLFEKLASVLLLILGSVILLAGVITIILNRVGKKMIYPKPKY